MKNDFTRMAKRIRRLPDAIENSVNANIKSEMVEMAALARVNAPKSLLHLTGSIGYDRASDLAVTASSGVGGRTYGTHIVRSSAPYSAMVEYGTGVRQRGRPQGPDGGDFRAPSIPPFGHIKNWMIQKPVSPRTGDIDASAELIAQSIAQYGQSPSPFMRPAWHEVGGTAALQIAHSRGLRKALQRI